MCIRKALSVLCLFLIFLDGSREKNVWNSAVSSHLILKYSEIGHGYQDSRYGGEKLVMFRFLNLEFLF